MASSDVDSNIGRCSRCVNSSSGQKEIDTIAISPSIAISKCSVSGNGSHAGSSSVEIEWEHDLLPDHKTSFTVSELAALANEDAKVSHPMPWNHTDIAHAYETGQIVARFHDYMDSSAAFQQILTALDTFGLAFITHVTTDETAVEQIGEKIGPLRHTFYGRAWDVKDKPNAENVAYTATELGLHMDLL